MDSITQQLDSALSAAHGKMNMRMLSALSYNNTIWASRCMCVQGCTAGQLALAWVLAQGKDVIPIPGMQTIVALAPQ